ncbi:MAG: helix-turn-helix domain-containing protein [Oscillospiraceae bacterium]|nr:helix-turn-helix domain-containing protein [Oscillospiraceae bacterium]
MIYYVTNRLERDYVISGEIKRLRTERGISQKEMGERLGVGQSAVAMWERGTNKPSYDILLAIAELFGVSVSVLTGEENVSMRIPVLGKVQAGLPCTATEDIIGYEEMSAEESRYGEFFALKIRGRSMEPRFVEGDTVIVRRQSSVDNGDIAIVLVGSEEATCKKFYRHSDGITLVSLNSEFEPMHFSPEELKYMKLEVIGKVCELRARFG